MSEEKNNIDQLYSDAAHSEEAPQYDAAYWAEMNATLNARDAKKRVFLYWAFGGLGAFTVLLFSLFTLNMNDSSTEELYVREKMNLKTDDVGLENSNKSTWIQRDTDLNEVENRKSNTTQSQNDVRGKQEFIESNPSYNEKSVTSKSKNDQEVINKTNVEVNNIDVRNEKQLPSRKTETPLDQSLKSYTNINPKELKELVISLPYPSTDQLAQKKAGSIIKSTLKLKPKPRYVLYAKFSGGLMENYKTSRPYESGLLNLSLNIEANLNNVLLRTGVGTQLTSNADLIVSQQAKVYSFGVTNYQNDLSYQSLIDIYIPLEIGYQFNNTSFGVGAQANYLVTTSIDLNHYENNFLIRTDQYFGNTNGLNNFATQGYVWLEQKFTSRILLGIKVGTNISGRIKDDAYFNQSATTNPIYGQLSLRFNFTK